MPVVSRSVAAAEPVSDVGDGDHGPDAVEMFHEVPAVSNPAMPGAARSVTEPSAPALTAHPDILPDGERPTAAAAPRPFALAPAAGLQTMPAGGPAAQRSIADDVPVDTSLHAAASTPPAEPLAPSHNSRAVRSADGPRVSGQTVDGKPTTDASSLLPDAVGIQRTTKPAADAKTRAIPTSAGPVVLRIVPASGVRPTPDTWQRLTALPVAASAPRAQNPAVAQRTATLPGQSPAAAAGPGYAQPGFPAAATAFAPTAAMFADSYTAGTGNAGVGTAGTAGTDDVGTDYGFGAEGDHGARTESGHAADAGASAVAGSSPGPTTAVGRVIQRTISVARDSAEGGGPTGGAVTGFPVGSAAPVQIHTVSPTSAARPGGERPGSLQRWTESPGTAGPSLEHAATVGYLATRTFTPFQTDPGAQTVPGYGSATARTTLRSLASPPVQRAEGDDAFQREPGTPGTGFAPEVPAASEVTAPAASGPGEADGGAAVQPGTTAGAAGAAAQGPASRGAAASGTPAGATPEQLEELAKRLTGPLIRRIKAEMLLDRERRGLRTDTN